MTRLDNFAFTFTSGDLEALGWNGADKLSDEGFENLAFHVTQRLAERGTIEDIVNQWAEQNGAQYGLERRCQHEDQEGPYCTACGEGVPGGMAHCYHDNQTGPHCGQCGTLIEAVR